MGAGSSLRVAPFDPAALRGRRRSLFPRLAAGPGSSSMDPTSRSGPPTRCSTTPWRCCGAGGGCWWGSGSSGLVLERAHDGPEQVGLTFSAVPFTSDSRRAGNGNVTTLNPGW